MKPIRITTIVVVGTDAMVGMDAMAEMDAEAVVGRRVPKAQQAPLVILVLKVR